ncbi:hypothetical protein Tco_0987831 [Tanacetum coccineum]
MLGTACQARISGLGLWDEDDTCWTESFLVLSSSYVKSLFGHVLMWNPVGSSASVLSGTLFSLFLLFMSGSEPGEMAPESSQAVVLPKFDMHVYTSILTAKELKEAITEYCIPTDLHPRLPPPDLTMNRLPSKYIGIYIEQLEKGGLQVPFLPYFLP